MKFKTLLCTSASIVVVAAAQAQSNYFEDTARVVRVTPQYEQINQPRQECRTEYETRERYRPQQDRQHSNNSERSNGGALIGGIAGGLLGSQVGGGNGKIAAAAAGALLGGLAGDRIDNNHHAQPAQSYYDQPSYETRPVRQCRNVEQWETRTNGYAITYEYQGRSYTTIMPYDPGPRLRLNVALTPRM